MRRRYLLGLVLLGGGALLLLVVASTLWLRAEPASANPATGLTGISAGSGHTCALADAGNTIMCWGQIALSEMVSIPTERPSVGEAVVQLSMGRWHGCGVTASGAAKCSGWNGNGQLGDGTTVYSDLPVDVVGLESGVAAIAAGATHTCALTVAGGVTCWGANYYGQLGDGTTTTTAPPYGSTTPVGVAGLSSGVAAIGAGSNHTCAVMETGGVKCWGRNDVGQLGDGTTTNSSVPVDVTGLSGSALAVVLGGDIDTGGHTCALLSSGSAQCWGFNVEGQLGDGTGVSSSTPVEVVGLGGTATALSAGVAHTCALLSSGAVQCWGWNLFGQLGNGTISDSLVPVSPAGLGTDNAEIAAGYWHTCAGKSDTSVRCWGNNGAGQVGDGTFENRSVPAPVVEAFAKPTPTATPCEPNCPTETNTPTATSTPTPTVTPTPAAPGLDFSIGIDPLGGSQDACTSTGMPGLTCTLRSGKPFTVRVYLNGLPDLLPNGDYEAFIGAVEYAGASSFAGFDLTPWADCAVPGFDFSPAKVTVICSVGKALPSTYTGLMATLEFSCISSGAVRLRHGFVNTTLIEQTVTRFAEGEGTSEHVNIQCVVAQPYPADGDGDGCPDVSEDWSAEQSGGLRNFLNPYDYFNPSGDGQNRMDDVMLVLGQYFIDAGDPAYTESTDRTLIGPDPWNLGPPDGRQRVDDVVHALNQYFHDCA